MDLGLTQPGGKGGMKNPHMGQGCGRIIRERESAGMLSFSLAQTGKSGFTPGHS